MNLKENLFVYPDISINPTTHFDYLIAGGGMAGLSLAYYLSQSNVLNNKKILILDKEQKTYNDRTWCFWERGEQNPFEKIIYRKWQKLDFFGDDFFKRFHLNSYFYKMIRGADFYHYIWNQLTDHPNITFIQQDILAINTTDKGAIVQTPDASFTAAYIFDSTFQPDFTKRGNHFLLQHFKGWVITTPTPHFDESCATLHDFRINQHGDAARFFYILPFSKTKALIEFTIFSSQILTDEQYTVELKKYLKDTLGLDAYTIEEEEFGIIPMSDSKITTQINNTIIRIGTSGGYVRPATGYTFARTQRYLQTIVRNLETGVEPLTKSTHMPSRFHLYDSILLNVLTKKRYSGAKFFTQLYQHNPIERIFDFLDEQSKFTEELRLMSTVPMATFTKAAIDILF
ncbi:lycopene cyclase family protein [Xanthocytophaga agilis]|uniref:Lycopene cyclase family protein n=1 Tax=Xanthocytophaga agilis TaxID=3048010 RepID=A0AAE3RBT6_9BACT|nr:lycopene cyclase family protein [Xanthocytophaga agilis]MDJ1504593.1 lycopene cyclase family protein [Xanthocytophaga agilis]